MRNVCRFFMEGKCKFGLKCKYDHVRYTSLVDPPQWIYSSYSGLDMVEISPEEVRFALMCGDMKEMLDNFWISNYMAVCGEMDLLGSDARVESVSNRHVDPRESPEVFMAPFDVDRVLGTIQQMREQGMRAQQRKPWEGRRGDGRWSSTSSGGSPRAAPVQDRGYKEKGWGQQRPEAGGWTQGGKPRFDRASGHGEQRGFVREQGQPRGRDSDYRPKGSWGHERGKGYRPEEEFDVSEASRAFQGYGGRDAQVPRGGWVHGEAAGNRQGRGGDEEFIEEDFEYGKVPYSYRKPGK